MSNITESDLDMIAYFYFDRGDMTRWSYWEERKEIILKEIPVFALILQKESEIAMLTRLLKSDIEEMGMELRRLEREMEGES